MGSHVDDGALSNVGNDKTWKRLDKTRLIQKEGFVWIVELRLPSWSLYPSLGF